MSAKELLFLDEWTVVPEAVPFVWLVIACLVLNDGLLISACSVSFGAHAGNRSTIQ
jgi:hypothetical protein